MSNNESKLISVSIENRIKIITLSLKIYRNCENVDNYVTEPWNCESNTNEDK